MPYPNTPEGRKRNAEAQHRWYIANKEKQLERTDTQKKKNRLRNRAIVLERLKTGCADCDEKDPIVLEFDHVRGEKKQNISYMVGAPSGLEALIIELDKCEVVCRNCHQRRTAKTFGFWKTLDFQFDGFESQQGVLIQSMYAIIDLMRITSEQLTVIIRHIELLSDTRTDIVNIDNIYLTDEGGDSLGAIVFDSDYDSFVYVVE